MKRLIAKGWRPVTVLILLLVLWEGAVRQFDVPNWILPAPSVIANELIYGADRYLPHIASSVQLALTSYGVAVLFGLTVALTLFRVEPLKEAMYPLLIISQNIPVIVLAPLLVIWFGFGMLPKVIVITLVCFFPITIATLDGLRQTNPAYIHYMKMIGATDRHIFWKVEWPHALPSIFSGLKIAATYSVMGAVITEWIGANKGIGVYMTLASSSFKTERVFVAIVIVIALSLLFFACIAALERYTLRWQEGGRR